MKDLLLYGAQSSDVKSAVRFFPWRSFSYIGRISYNYRDDGLIVIDIDSINAVNVTHPFWAQIIGFGFSKRNSKATVRCMDRVMLNKARRHLDIGTPVHSRNSTTYYSIDTYLVAFRHGSRSILINQISPQQSWEF